MKNLTIKYLFSVILFLSVGHIAAQNEKDIHGDRTYYLGKDYKWKLYSLTGGYRTFGSYGPVFASAYAEDKKLYIMKYSNSKHEFYADRQIAHFNTCYIVHRPLMFEFADRQFILIYTENNNGHAAIRLYKGEDYSMEDFKPLHREYSYESHNDKLKIYQAAFSYGGALYLAYNKYYKYMGSGETDKEITIDPNDVYIDKCTVSNYESKINVDTTYHFKDVIPHSRFHIKTLNGFQHRDGHLRLLVSYYVKDIKKNENNESNENKGGGVAVLNLKTGRHSTLFHKDDYICAIDAVVGSIKGKKDHDSYKNEAFRIQVVYNHLEIHKVLRWKNIGHFRYRTYTYDGYKYKELYHGKILNYTNALPTSGDKMYLQLVSKMNPRNITDEDRNNDIIAKEIWLMHIGKHRGLWANVFNSDKFKPNTNTFTFSTDLMDDSTYGPGIRKLWTLIGVTEGAPPVSMNWQKWGNTHVTNSHPSTLKFSTTTTHETKVTSIFNRSWYSLTGIKLGGSKTKYAGSVSFKYTNAYQKSKTKEISTSLKISEEFHSSLKTQGHAYLLWLIPNVYRIKYGVYPWYDNDLTYSLDSSEVYMFYSTGNTLLPEEVPISQKPFNIQIPNDSTFSDWKVTNSYRDTIALTSGIYNIPALSLSWVNNGPGSTTQFTNERKSTISTRQKNEFSITGSVTYRIPKVFEITETGNFTWSYETDVSHTTSISKELEISMKNMENKSHDGANMSSIFINAYFFEPKKDKKGDFINWWYYKYFKNHHPWYITYIVNSASHKITVKTPYKNGLINASELFSWNHDTKEEYEYSILFCTDEFFGPENSVEVSVGKNMNMKLYDDIIQKFPKDSVIYWVVKGKNSKNRYAWSSIHWFILADQYSYSIAETETNRKLLDFIAYPNPVSGDYIKIAFAGGLDNSEIHAKWISLNGETVYETNYDFSEIKGSTLRIKIPSIVSGYYILHLSTATSEGVAKVIIVK